MQNTPKTAAAITKRTTKHAGKPKQAFCTRHFPNFHSLYLLQVFTKISYQQSSFHVWISFIFITVNATPAMEFAFCPHLAPALTMRFTKSTQCENDNGGLQSVACDEQHLVFWKRQENISPVTRNDFWRVTQHVAMSPDGCAWLRNSWATSRGHTLCFYFEPIRMGTKAWVLSTFIYAISKAQEVA